MMRRMDSSQKGRPPLLTLERPNQAGGQAASGLSALPFKGPWQLAAEVPSDISPHEAAALDAQALCIKQSQRSNQHSLDVGWRHSTDVLLDGRLDCVWGPFQVIGVCFACFEVLVDVCDLKVARPLACPAKCVCSAIPTFVLPSP